MTSSGTRATRATRREWIGLAVLALPTLLLSLDLSVLHLALPHLVLDLRPSSTQLLWIIDSYGFMIAGFLVTMGTLGDRIGRRRLLLAGAAAFGVASVLAAYSTSAEMLIVTRALLGVAGATLMPSTLALISNMFRDPGQRATAVAVWMSCFLAGVAVGPLIGGVLLELFWWGSVFLLGVPVMALLLVAGPVLLPEFRDRDAGRLDLISVALSLLTILPMVHGLKELAVDGPAPAPIVALTGGLAVGALFVRRQRRLASPLVDMGLFRNRAFSAALAVMLLGTVTLGGTNLFVTQYLQLVAGLSPLQAGLWLAPPALSVIVTSMLAPGLGRRFGPGTVVAVGLLVTAVGMGWLTRVDAGSALLPLGAAFVLAFAGTGPLGVLGTDLVIGSAPPGRAGSAASMSETVSELGVALGVAALGSLGSAVYRRRIADALRSDALGPDAPARAADAARETLAGAVQTAQALPGGAGPALLAQAKSAFTSGLNTVAAVNAALVVVFAVVSFVLLRQVPPEADPPRSDDSEAPASHSGGSGSGEVGSG